MNINTAKIESLVRQLLLEIGEDPEREGLLKTPERVRGELLNHAVDRGWRTVLHGTEVVVLSASCGTYSSLPFTCRPVLRKYSIRRLRAPASTRDASRLRPI
jgi:GTP cyclohydrolase I